MVALKEASSTNIIGPEGIDPEKMSDFTERMAKWINMFSYMPDERSGVKGYGWSMVKLARFYATLIGKMGNEAGLAELTDEKKQYARLHGLMTKAGLKVERFRTMLDEE